MRAKLFGGNALVYILTRFVVACLFVLFPISCMAYNNDSNNEVVYYWKVKNGKKPWQERLCLKIRENVLMLFSLHTSMMSAMGEKAL